MIQAVQCWIYVHSVLLHVLGSFDTNSLTHIYCDALHSRIKNVAACYWMCTFFAVILNRFTTLKGKRICAGPGKVWTKTSMAYLDGKNWQIQRVTSLTQYPPSHKKTRKWNEKLSINRLLFEFHRLNVFFLQTPDLILVTLHDIITLLCIVSII